ncbi:13600_t:CDS:2, partial [Gigaspora margarita]
VGRKKDKPSNLVLIDYLYSNNSQEPNQIYKINSEAPLTTQVRKAKSTNQQIPSNKT